MFKWLWKKLESFVKYSPVLSEKVKQEIYSKGIDDVLRLLELKRKECDEYVKIIEGYKSRPTNGPEMRQWQDRERKHLEEIEKLGQQVLTLMRENRELYYQLRFYEKLK